MEKNQQSMSVSDAVYKLQLALLNGFKTLDQLYLARSIISRSDYDDVVTERSITNLCGYPLCSNALPSKSSRPRKGHYRISLPEHKVYDLHETYLYCSASCVVESKAFAQSLSEERCDVLDCGKMERVLRGFGEVGFDKGEVLGEVGDLGISKLNIEERRETDIGDLRISKLKIEENSETNGGNMGLEEFVGPSNAIEGYVPQNERISKSLGSKKREEGSKGKDKRMSAENQPGIDLLFNEMDFMSTIITSDEYNVSKIPTNIGENGFGTKLKESKGKVGPNNTHSGKKSRQSKGAKGTNVKKDDIAIRGVPSTSDASQTVSNGSTKEEREEFLVERAEKSSEAILRSSLRPSGSKKLNRSVTWADETIDSTGSRNLCEVRDMEHRTEDPDAFGSMYREVQDAIARAMALNQASEAVASGESDVTDAVLEAGIVILPRPEGANEEERTQDVDMLEPEHNPLKIMEDADILEPEQARPGGPDYNLFESEDSLFDAPPEGFSLTLSPFATMWNSLFSWITSSTLAYIYGRDDSFHEEFLYVDETNYPQKIALADGRSSEIKQTLAETLARTLPIVVSELRLAAPVSSLEQGMARMLDTMSFIDALPAFRMKQWQVIVLLFMEGLSVCRIPALIPHMTNRRMLFQKVLDGSQIGAEEYELMKNLIIPLGRAPQFSAQSGA